MALLATKVERGVRFPSATDAFYRRSAAAALFEFFRWNVETEIMDRIQVACPSCHSKLGIPAGRAGSVECPKCKSTFSADTRTKNRNANDEGWQDRLLGSLSDTGVIRSKLDRGPIYISLVLRFIGAMVVLFPFLWGIDYFYDHSSTTPWALRADFWLISFFFFGILTGAVRVPIIRLFRQMRAVGADKALQDATRRPVLYLRSFHMDELIGRQTLLDYLFHGNFRSNALGPEDQLAKRFSKVGPVIAIGRPNEEMPSLGAARFYVSDGKWQEKVADIAREAQFVVWVSGTTGGLRWELDHLVGSVAPQQLILWAHPYLLRLSAAKREREWRAFLERLGNTFPVPLPSRLGAARLFFFGPTFAPQPVKANEYALWSPQADALRTLFVAKGLLTPPAWVWRTSNRAVALLFGFVVGMLVSIALGYYAYRHRGGLVDAGFPFYIMNAASYTTILVHGLFGAAFVAAQPRLARIRGGYRAGALLFVPILMLLPTLIFPTILAVRGRPSWLRATIERGDWFDLIVFINSFAVSALAWVVPLVLLLRFLPFAPGRPRRPDASTS